MGLFLFRHGAGGKPSGWLAMPAQSATQKLLIALMSSDDERIALSLPTPCLIAPGASERTSIRAKPAPTARGSACTH